MYRSETYVQNLLKGLRDLKERNVACDLTLASKVFSFSSFHSSQRRIQVFRKRTREHSNFSNFPPNSMNNFGPYIPGSANGTDMIFCNRLINVKQQMNCVFLARQGFHSGWKTWKIGKAFSSHGKVMEF